MKNKNFDKKYAELSALIDDFIATISATPLPDFSGMPEQEFRSQWHEFEKTSLCAFLSEVKKRFADYGSFSPCTTQEQFLHVLSFLGDLDWWDAPYAANPAIDQIFSRECMESLPKYIGKEATCKFCGLMNEIISESLKPM